MPKDATKLLWRVTRKARKLRQALVRELGEEVDVEQCKEWVCTTYGFRTCDDLIELYQPDSFAFDEMISGSSLRRRLSLQAESLAFDFDLDAAVALRLVKDVRPTSLRLAKNSESEG